MAPEGPRSAPHPSEPWVVGMLNRGLHASMRKESPADWDGVESVVDALVAEDEKRAEYGGDFHLSVGRATEVLHAAGGRQLARWAATGLREELETAEYYLGAAVRCEGVAQARLEGPGRGERPTAGSATIEPYFQSTFRLNLVLHDLGKAQISLEKWNDARASIEAARTCVVRLPALNVRAKAVAELAGRPAPRFGWRERAVYAHFLKVHDRNLADIDATRPLWERASERAFREGVRPIGAVLSDRARRTLERRNAGLSDRAARPSPGARRAFDRAGSNPWGPPMRDGRTAG